MGSVSIKDDKFRAQMKALLTDAQHGHAQGWQVALDIGPPLMPLLWDMRAVEKADDRRRMVLTAAAMAAGGLESDEQALAAIDLSQQNDPLMACLMFALGPNRAHEQSRYWERVRGRRTEPPELHTVLALLAASRFPGAAAAPAAAAITQFHRSSGSGVVQSPGVLAAALFAGVPVPDSVLKPYLAFEQPPRHAELVWRGMMLGALRERDSLPDATVVQRAQRVFALSGDSLAGAREAAALVLGRAGAIDGSGPRPPWPVLQLLAADPRSAAQLSNWLYAAPSPIDEEPARLAVEYALSRPVATVIEQRDDWSKSAAVRRHVAVALAIRLLADEAVQPIELALPEVPEWFFVQWASGAKAEPRGTIQGTSGQPDSLDALMQLVRDGRATRAVVRDRLEEALWRWGSHPGLGLFTAQRTLIRDLVLTGSLAGAKYNQHVPMHERYLPGGLGSSGSSEPFFAVGVEAYDFFSVPRLPLPSECRLR